MKLIKNYFPTVLLALVVLISACGGKNNSSDPAPEAKKPGEELQTSIAKEWTISVATQDGTDKATGLTNKKVTISAAGVMTSDASLPINGKTLKISEDGKSSTIDGKANKGSVSATTITLNFTSDEAGNITGRGLTGPWVITMN